jgi:subfamily B ATP-binding cassette protein HlyB/CyaB
MYCAGEVWPWQERRTAANDVCYGLERTATINGLNGNVSMLFITHAMPKNLLVDEVVRIGQGTLSAVSDAQDEPKREVEGGVHG